jgi:hypothetical protein
VVTTRLDLLVRGADNRSFIATQELLQALWGLAEAPWDSMPKTHKPLTAHGFFPLLKRFKIESKANPAGTLRGIYVDRILEEYDRYKGGSPKGTSKPDDDDPPEPPQKPPPPHTSGGGTTSEAPHHGIAEKFSKETPGNKCQVSEEEVNTLSSNNLWSDTSSDTLISQSVRSAGCIPSDTSPGMKCQTVSYSTVTSYPCI